MPTILLLFVGYILTGAKWFPRDGVSELTGIVSVGCLLMGLWLLFQAASGLGRTLNAKSQARR